MALPDPTLLATIVDTPKGNLIYHLWEPRAAVAAYQGLYDAMIASLKLVKN